MHIKISLYICCRNVFNTYIGICSDYQYTDKKTICNRLRRHQSPFSILQK